MGGTVCSDTAWCMSYSVHVHNKYCTVHVTTYSTVRTLLYGGRVVLFICIIIICTDRHTVRVQYTQQRIIRTAHLNISGMRWRLSFAEFTKNLPLSGDLVNGVWY